MQTYTCISELQRKKGLTKPGKLTILQVTLMAKYYHEKEECPVQRDYSSICS